MTSEGKKAISLFCLSCSSCENHIVIHCPDEETVNETFIYGLKVLKNCRGNNGCESEDHVLLFQSGSTIEFTTYDVCDGCHGCDEIKEKESEVQDAFEDLLKGFGKKE